jgi:hypothetical protein
MLAMLSRPRTRCGAEACSQQVVYNVVDPALGNSLRNTPTEMCLQDVPTDPIQGTLHRRQLMEDVDAVTVLFHHAEHTIEMTPGRPEPEPHRVDIGPHR